MNIERSSNSRQYNNENNGWSELSKSQMSESVIEQDWQNDSKERETRLGQLGVDASINIESLTDAERQFLDMPDEARKYIDHSAAISQMNKKRGRDNEYRRFYIDAFIQYYNALLPRPSASSGIEEHNNDERLSLALIDAMLNLDLPPAEIRKVAPLILTDDTPNFAKQMTAFKIQHPIERIPTELDRDNFKPQSASSGISSDNRHITSPSLATIFRGTGKVKDERGREYGAEEIIYYDLLKSAFGSGGRNIERFLDKLVTGERIMGEVLQLDNDNKPIRYYAFTESQLSDLRDLLRQLHALHYQTVAGQEQEYYHLSPHDEYNEHDEFMDRSLAEVKTEISRVIDEYQPTKRYGLADRVVRKFCHPLGIKDVQEAYYYIFVNRKTSNLRHYMDMHVGELHEGDFVKAVSTKHLPYLLENGILAKEYLGVGEESDQTPLDTDVSIITEEPTGLRDAISKTSAAAFSGLGGAEGQHYYGNYDNVFLVFRNDERFDIDNPTANTRFDRDKYEAFRFYGGHVVKRFSVEDELDDEYWYRDDCGIRTGVPSTEIDYIVTDEVSANKVIEAIKESGLYIPVVSLEGTRLF